MSAHAFFTFASPAEIVGLWGIGFLVLAIIALIAERRRIRRERIDRVGWVPWTTVFLASAIVGVALIALAGQGMLAGARA